MRIERKCCVPNCPGNGTIYHKFPIPGYETETIKEWVKRIGNSKLLTLNEKQVYCYYYICNLHFSDHCKVSDETRLKKGSLPTLLLPGFDGESNEETSNIAPNSQNDNTNKKETSCVKFKPKVVDGKLLFRSMKSFCEVTNRMNDVCRICLHSIKKEGDVVKLYEETDIDLDSVKKMRGMLQTVLPDLDQNLYPNLVICTRCKDRVTASFEFFVMSKANEKELQLILEKKKYYLSCKDDTDVDIVLAEEKDVPDFLKDHSYTRIQSPYDNIVCDNNNLPKERITWGKGPFLCEICGISKNDVNQFRNHVISHNPKQISKSGMCDICGEMFKDIFILKRHVTRVHQAVHQCDFCSIKLSNYQELLQHKKTAHVKTYCQCHICGKLLKKSALKMHLLIHNDKRKFECNICNKRFVFESNLKYHRQRHNNISPVQCPYCQKYVKHQLSLQVHVRAFHTFCKYRCEVCQKLFQKGSELRMHRIKKHPVGVNRDE